MPLPLPIFTDFTLGDAWADLGSRLADPDHVRWPEAELTIYVQQAIRTYNALTNHFRATTSFRTTLAEAFYDLQTIAPSLRGMTYTVAQALDQLARQLMEPPPTGATWNGTSQFSIEDLRQSLQQARDTFLLETGVLVSRHQQAVDLSTAQNLLPLDQAIFNLRRLAWKTSDGNIAILRRTDQWGITNFAGTTWQTPTDRPPRGYSVSTQPPLTVQFAPMSTQTGTVDMLTLDRGEAVDLNDPAQLLGVPDDWAWVVIYGALQQLLQRDGLALDPGRAAYCAARWQHGVMAAKQAAVVLAVDVQGRSVGLGSVNDADAYSPSWQMVPGVPRRVLTAGQTIIGLWPPPGVPVGGGSFVITLELVQNAPVPLVETDPIQLGQEVLNDLLDYAQHEALVKEGVGQIQAAQGLLDQFMGLCGTTLAIQYASQPNEIAAVGQSVQDVRSVPVETR